MSRNAVRQDPYRPHVHYTPAANWINDPNGLVYFGGQYHLFYQYNPYSSSHAHMHWGQAVSTDLVHWQERGVALTEGEHQIFSGSAVVDWKNSSGLGDGTSPFLVACYTGHTETHQAQYLASSQDRGETWTLHPDAVLDRGKQDFRDPKVFWHAPSAAWIMTVVHPIEREVELLRSADLHTWTSLSVFGPTGETGGIWEVPDLFPVLDDDGQEHWVLKVDLNPGGPYGGSGVQYWLGDFDGQRFTTRTPSRWVDHGQDFYAAITWHDLPERRVWLSWMSNWQYAHHVPTATEGWRGAMSLPREVGVSVDADGPILVQRPVPELQILRQTLRPLHLGVTSLQVDQAHEFLLNWSAAESFHVRLEFRSEAGIEVSVEVTPEEVVVRRPKTVVTAGLDGYAGEHRAPLPPLGAYDLHLFLDASSLEVFAGGGRAIITDLLFPAQPICEATCTIKGLDHGSFTGALWPLSQADFST
ncbi:glycoside hydrolase family 32 protein [Deinococcus psychrotolerans]|uniref:Glycoside hydrolase family 32 protein n=1 Tax=Deinococcus psychrotolerans TaxID=2489213 RepID=A0A3G8YGD6_9DEIO|nr:glycoside hydrolase family 32 protein [Deinococcus psychrotolerans]AZI44348.1 glycoside hydrolase family 32 protein [Deinococcus psychrotolerans]